MQITDSHFEALEDVVKALAEYFYVEMHWENFRAEMLSEPGSDQERAYEKNARALHRFLESTKAKHPKIAELIDSHMNTR